MEQKEDKKRLLVNLHTGIDLCISSVKEVEAPLGGTSIEYEVAVVSSLQLFTSNISNKEDTGLLHYSVFKTYRECEDLVNKLRRIDRECKFLVLPKAQASLEEKRAECDKVMKQIASNSDLVRSSILLQFLGVDPKTKQLMIDISPPEIKNKIENEDKSASGSDEKEDFDLFEELVKKEKAKNGTPRRKDVAKREDHVPKEVFASQNLQSGELLVTKNAPKAKISTDERDLHRTTLFSEGRKPGDISLFEDQDYEGTLTKEEEHLFIGSEKKLDERKIDSETESKEDSEDIFHVEDDLGILLMQNQLISQEPICNQEMQPFVDAKQPLASPSQQSSFTAIKTPSPDRVQNPNKPAPPPKPKSLAKPIPPPKPKPNSQGTPNIKDDVTDSGELDIFKYIEQEEKANTQEASLFD